MALALPAPIAAWLGRAGAHDRLAVRGSIVLAALSDRARMPADVDHVALGDATLDDASAWLRELAGDWPVGDVEVLWPDSPAPGVRAVVTIDGAPLQVDIAVREPLAAPLEVHGGVRCVGVADLAAWKIHGLVEFGLGQWRPKDVYDLDVLAGLAIPRDVLRAAVERAFASRNDQLAVLDDFLDRPAWGESASGRRRWRQFARTHPGTDDFPATRDRVRAFVRGLVR